MKKILSIYNDYLGEVITPKFYVIFLEVGYILSKKKKQYLNIL